MKSKRKSKNTRIILNEINSYEKSHNLLSLSQRAKAASEQIDIVFDLIISSHFNPNCIRSQIEAQQEIANRSATGKSVIHYSKPNEN